MSYSQGLEEQVIIDFFGSYVGTFLDIGANDGITLSNTYQLAINKWSGVCIEPSPIAFDKLVNIHKPTKDNFGIYCFQYAIGNENKQVKFYSSGSHLTENDSDLLSTINLSDKEKWASTTDFKEIEVDMITFGDLMKFSPYKSFDFISIDAEGNDISILNQIDLNFLGCKLLCIEHNGDYKTLKLIIEICSKYGLTKQLLKNTENIILCHD